MVPLLLPPALVILFNSYALEFVPIFYYRDKTRVQMFYFLNNIELSVFLHMRKR